MASYTASHVIILIERNLESCFNVHKLEILTIGL